MASLPLILTASLSTEKKTLQADSLSSVAIHLERNVVDRRGKVLIEVYAGDCKLRWLRVERPDGGVVAYYDTQRPEGRNGDHLLFERLEPTVEEMLGDYPPGTYTFVARTLCGDEPVATAFVTPYFPPAIAIKFPPPGSGEVPTSGLRIEWDAVVGLDHYVVTLNQENLGIAFSEVVRADQNFFRFPDDLLKPGFEYFIGITAFGRAGNGSLFETTFHTSGAARENDRPEARKDSLDA